MKRVVLFVAMALLLVSFSSLASDPVVIQYWHAMSGPLGEAVERGVDAFNESQDLVYVEVEYKGSYRDTLNATIAAIRAGNPPHIIQNFEIATQQIQNILNTIAKRRGTLCLRIKEQEGCSCLLFYFFLSSCLDVI